MATLAELESGKAGTVAAIKGDTAVKQRLTSMGFIKGASVEVGHESLFADPRTYIVKGYTICMRKNEAEQIILA